MSDSFKDRHAKLGCMVLRLFPQVMQMILKYYVTPHWLKRKYLQQDYRFVFMENEIVLMDKLPNMDEFTIEICYKILRSENMLDEPKCKWGNVPHDVEVEIADDIQRLINATNSITSLKPEEVTNSYSEKLLQDIKLIVTRMDSFFKQDTLRRMYNTLSRSGTDSTSVLQDLALIKAIEATEFLPNIESEGQERYSRLSMAIIETFPKVLRHVIRSRISASQLYQMCEPFLKMFYPEQRTSLKELQNSNTYDSLDITIVYILLRQFSLIPSPTKGWGIIPDNADTKLGDDIERIRCYRNQLVHRRNTNIDKSEFDDCFNKFRDICRRMDLNVFQNTNYEMRIIGHRTCTMDAETQIKYENAMKEIETIKLKFEKRPITFYWGENFERSLRNLRSLLKEEILEGRQKVRLQIIFQTEDDVEKIIDILNSLKDEINEGLTGIEFIVATKGSIVLNADILLEMIETDEMLQSTLALFLEKILERIRAFTTESIDMVLLPIEETTQWNKSKPSAKACHLNFDIEAELFETDNKIEEQLSKISEAISKHSNGSGTNNNMTATLLPISLEKTSITGEAFVLPVFVTLRQQLNVKLPRNEYMNIGSCIKIGNTLVFTDYLNKQLIIRNTDVADVHYFPMPYRPCYITDIDSNTVAVTCTLDRFILIINISTGDVTSTIETSDCLWGISFYDNNLYVVIGRSIKQMHVMDLTGNVRRTLPLGTIRGITVHRDRLVCIELTTISCFSLDGKLLWKFENEKYRNLNRVITDNEGNVYVTDENTNTVVVVFDDGQHYRDILAGSDELCKPAGIHFDKKQNILFVCNRQDGKAFLFDVKKK